MTASPGSPRRNRVSPFGDIEATPARGLLMGNRGILHDDKGELGRARWRSRAWISCVLAYKGARRAIMTPGSYTELFFCDEAVAMAAGHRPCALCRRADFERFRAAWARGPGEGRAERAAAIDARLHASRLDAARRPARFPARLGDLPDGAMATRADPGVAWLVREGSARRWSHVGYGPSEDVDPDETVTVLTPRLLVDALRAGYAPLLHPSAG